MFTIGFDGGDIIGTRHSMIPLSPSGRKGDAVVVRIGAAALKVRVGQETRLVIADEAAMLPADHDAKLVRLVAETYAVQEQLLSGMSLADLATQNRSSPARISKLARIAWLAPDIIAAIVEGRQPRSLDRRALMEATQIPLDWPGQRRMFGFA